MTCQKWSPAVLFQQHLELTKQEWKTDNVKDKQNQRPLQKNKKGKRGKGILEKNNAL